MIHIAFIMILKRNNKCGKYQRNCSFIIIRDMADIMDQSLPDSLLSSDMLKIGQVMVLNGIAKIAVRDKTP